MLSGCKLEQSCLLHSMILDFAVHKPSCLPFGNHKDFGCVYGPAILPFENPCDGVKQYYTWLWQQQKSHRHP